ncbi:MAG: hypothetical protein HKL96_06370 [Phycisphaerales bacterium]|nr:hypothetical protein [Phycisphaerales bacterium]
MNVALRSVLEYFSQGEAVSVEAFRATCMFMTFQRKRWQRVIHQAEIVWGCGVLLFAALLMGGCSSVVVPPLRLAATAAPTTASVNAFLRQWPTRGDRQFFGTLYLHGRRMTVIGRLHYMSTTDIRLTVATELGQMLFDTRFNWAGPHVLHCQSEFPKVVASGICADMKLALHLPKPPVGLKVHSHSATLQQENSFRWTFNWTFAGAKGEVVSQRVNRHASLFGGNTTVVRYSDYNGNLFPGQITLYRRKLNYSLRLNFTDQRKY